LRRRELIVKWVLNYIPRALKSLNLPAYALKSHGKAAFRDLSRGSISKCQRDHLLPNWMRQKHIKLKKLIDSMLEKSREIDNARESAT
jgi:hypothetical protein